MPKLAEGPPEAPVEVEGGPPPERHGLSWKGMAAEAVTVRKGHRVEFHFRGARHLLVVYARGVRSAGETAITGFARSPLRQLERRFTFVPAGYEYLEWLEALNTITLTFFYIDPAGVTTSSTDEAAPVPRLLFDNPALFSSALKLTALINAREDGDVSYVTALGTVLSHELLFPNGTRVKQEPPTRGGLAPWQQRIVATYIDEHLAEQISLDALARLVGLSRYYFCRAFKQSFGVPPHRYHTSRRIERAKALLATHSLSVTQIGFQVGFSDTSAFSAAFRKITGLTPTAYLRNEPFT